MEKDNQSILPLARTSDPSTSHEAAARVRPNVQKLEALVLNIVRRYGNYGATTREIAKILKMDRDTISPRIKPLRIKRYLKAHPAGKRRGHSTVWVVSEVL